MPISRLIQHSDLSRSAVGRRPSDGRRQSAKSDGKRGDKGQRRREGRGQGRGKHGRWWGYRAPQRAGPRRGGPHTHEPTHRVEKPTSAPTNNYPYYPILYATISPRALCEGGQRYVQRAPWNRDGEIQPSVPPPLSSSFLVYFHS